MAPTGNFRAVRARRLFLRAACATLLLPSLVAAAPLQAGAATGPAALSQGAPLPCIATLVQMLNDALFSGTAGEHKLVTFALPPGRRLLPATGGATPQAALIGQMGAKSAQGQCAFETTAYAAVPFEFLVGLLNMSPKAKVVLKKLESLSPAQKEVIDNFFITGKAPKGTNPLAMLGGAQEIGPAVRQRYRKLTVKVTKLTPTGATMNVSGLEAGTETVGSRTRTVWDSFTESGLEASKIDGRWFLSGAQAINFSA